MINHSEHKAVTLWDVFKQITMDQQPGTWFHNCPVTKVNSVELENNQICPDCYVDQYGSDHNKPGDKK